MNSLSEVRISILELLRDRSLHGYAIAKIIGRTPGAMSTTMQRMQDKKLVRSRLERNFAGNQRRRRIYSITPTGLAALEGAK